MTLDSTREVIGTALDTAPSVTGTALPPMVPFVGSAWPLVSELERGPGNCFMAEWRVICVIGADERSAALAFSDYADELLEAVEQVLYVQTIRPAVLPAQLGNLYCLEMIGVSQ